MAEFLKDLDTTYYYDVLDILGLKNPVGRFTVPSMFVKNDIVLLYLDDNTKPKDENVIEITSVEFDKLIK